MRNSFLTFALIAASTFTIAAPAFSQEAQPQERKIVAVHLGRTFAQPAVPKLNTEVLGAFKHQKTGDQVPAATQQNKATPSLIDRRTLVALNK
jgi:uncharacterized protein YggE